MSSIFTKIIQGEIPGTFVYRDDTVVAFLDISPFAYGHTLVVPVAEVDKWTDLEPQVWAHLNEVAQQIGAVIASEFGAPRSAYMIAGFDVPHTHIHLFPASSLADYQPGNQIPMDQVDKQRFEEAANIIRRGLGTGPDGYPK